jgi:hypothetical protein
MSFIKDNRKIHIILDESNQRKRDNQITKKHMKTSMKEINPSFNLIEQINNKQPTGVNLEIQNDKLQYQENNLNPVSKNPSMSPMYFEKTTVANEDLIKPQGYQKQNPEIKEAIIRGSVNPSRFKSRKSVMRSKMSSKKVKLIPETHIDVERINHTPPISNILNETSMTDKLVLEIKEKDEKIKGLMEALDNEKNQFLKIIREKDEQTKRLTIDRDNKIKNLTSDLKKEKDKFKKMDDEKGNKIKNLTSDLKKEKDKIKKMNEEKEKLRKMNETKFRELLFNHDKLKNDNDRIQIELNRITHLYNSELDIKSQNEGGQLDYNKK